MGKAGRGSLGNARSVERKEGEERGRDYAGAAKMNGSHAPVDWASTSEVKGIGRKEGGGKGERGDTASCVAPSEHARAAGRGKGSDKRKTCRESGEEQRCSDECRDKLVGGRADS